MLITKMRDRAGRPIKQIEFMTPHLIVYNMERLDDGTIIDGKFGLVDMMDYYTEDGSSIPFGEVEVEDGCMNFNGTQVEVTTDEEKSESTLANLMKHIPIVNKDEVN